VVVVYERVSTAAQDVTRQSVQRDRAAEENPRREIRVIQEPGGVSAFKVPIFERPAGRILCDLVESRHVHAIYVDAQDRLSRGDDVEWVSFRALCASTGTRIVIDGTELRDDLAGKLLSYIGALNAHEESREKGRRVRGGK